MPETIKYSIIALTALFLVLALGFTSAQGQEAGKFTAVVNQVDHVKKGQDQGVQAKVQDGVENHDVVRTQEKSRARLRFIDDTTMSVAPKSQVSIEEYMYDARKGKGQGVFKVIEGALESTVPLTDQSDIVIKTATAIAGIRG